MAQADRKTKSTAAPAESPKARLKLITPTPMPNSDVAESHPVAPPEGILVLNRRTVTIALSDVIYSDYASNMALEKKDVAAYLVSLSASAQHLLRMHPR